MSSSDQTPEVQADPMAPAKEVKRQVSEALKAGGVELGTATLPGGAKVPAIYVGDWPTGTVVSGLECLVPLSPRLSAPAGFSFLGFQRLWLLRLINNASHPDMLERAAHALAERFWPLGNDPQVMPASPDTCEQMVIGIDLDQSAL